MNNTTSYNRNTGNNNGDFKQYLSFEKRFGYLHAVREVPRSNPKTYSAKISVPQGQGKHIRYVNFEVYIKSADAIIAFFEHMESINNDKVKVTVRFNCNNVNPRGYVAERGKHMGEIVSYFSGNLSHLFSMKINGELVHGGYNDQSTQGSQKEVTAQQGKTEVSTNNTQSQPPTTDQGSTEVYEQWANEQQAMEITSTQGHMEPNRDSRQETKDEGVIKVSAQDGQTQEAQTDVQKGDSKDDSKGVRTEAEVDTGADSTIVAKATPQPSPKRAKTSSGRKTSRTTSRRSATKDKAPQADDQGSIDHSATEAA